VETTTATATAARSGTRIGYLGGGIEYALGQNWSVKGAAFHYDLGMTRSARPVISPKGSGRALGGAQIYATSQDRGIIGRVGLNDRFAGW
jgi:hypothetical protein